MRVGRRLCLMSTSLSCTKYQRRLSTRVSSAILTVSRKISCLDLRTNETQGIRIGGICQDRDYLRPFEK
jgi:hypothetical protein